MEIYYCFECDFDAVFLVNGVFFERVQWLKSRLEDSVYVTLLPLDALYLPYTVRLGDNQVFCNSALTKLYKLRENRFLARFAPRFNYVYSPKPHNAAPAGGSPVVKMFRALKSQEVAAARALLTPQLSASVDDNSLLAFFDGYTDCIDNDGYITAPQNTFFLVPDEPQKTAALMKADYKNGLIDDVTEL